MGKPLLKTMKYKLGKFIQQNTDLSRRKVFELIQDGKVKLNGNICTNFSKEIHHTKDIVVLNGEKINYKSKHFYYLFNKPKGIISTLSDPKGRPHLKEFMKKYRIPESVFPVGRLDRATKGLMIFTNDGNYANDILHPKFKLTKTYSVVLDKSITKNHVKRLLSGIILDDGPFCFDEITVITHKKFLVQLHEGRNRIIRRSFAAFDYEVIGLKRLSIGSHQITGIKEGTFKPFTP